ncbi:MAG: hypothetical protein L3J70_12490 [Gammaproteobacteria bacterium]|nr:hypothetical protein [Gammaproteobacteria bacterium]
MATVNLEHNSTTVMIKDMPEEKGSVPFILVRENLEVAARMHYHFVRSRQQIADDVPLQPEQVSQLDDAQIDRLDLYLARFSKLQDFITSKLFRFVALASLEDTNQPRCFPDRYSSKNGEVRHSP